MKQFLLLSVLFLYLFTGLQAASRSTTRVKGSVIDKTASTPLEFSTVSLTDTTGKTIAVNTSDEKGSFSLADVPAGNYTLKVSFVGYTDVEQPLEITAQQTDIDLGQISIEPDTKQLDAAVVSTKKPTIERQLDKLVVNIANTIAADNHTALELLKKAPGVSIDRDGNVTLNGQGVQVWVDNRPVQLSGADLVALLSSTEGSTIDKIEIIDNPSSKYDAAGSGGIINIKTKKNFIHGFNGNVRAGGHQFFAEDVDGHYFIADGALNLNYRNDLLSTFVNYNIRRYHGFNTLSEKVNAVDGYRRSTDGISKDYSTPQGVKAGADFFIDKKNTVGIIGNYNSRSMDVNNRATTIVGPSDAPDETSETDGTNELAFHNASLNLNYTRLFGDNTDHDLTVNLDYIYNSNTPEQYNNTIFNESTGIKPPEVFKSNANQLTQVYSAKADYVRPLNEQMKIEAGGKIGYSHNDSEILRLDSTQAGDWVKNTNLSNEFEYDETISALYFSYGWQINKQWSTKAGLRWENTYAKGTWKTSGKVTTQSYNDFFPTLFLGYTPHEKHNLSLSYTRRIQRPNYWNLNPFRQYMGAYTYVEGNPQVLPSYSDNLRLSYTAFQVLNIGTSFNYNKGIIVQVPQYHPENGQTGYTQDNFGTNYFFGAWVSVSGLPITKWWQLTLNLWGAYTVNDDNVTTTRSWQVNPYLNSTFLLSKTWSAEIEGWMQTPTIWGYYDMKAQGALSAGVKKTFCDNKGSVSLYIDDIFNTQRSDVTISRNGIISHANNRWDSRAIRVSFSWRFGNMSSPAKQRKVGQQEEADRMGGGGK